jgi:hypothetical protein
LSAIMTRSSRCAIGQYHTLMTVLRKRFQNVVRAKL